MQKNKGLVVVVDDDEDIRLALSMLLTNEGYQVMEAGSPAELASITARLTPHLVLLDMNFSRDTTSGSEGLEVLAQLTQRNIATVLMTAWGNIELAVKGMQLGAADFIEKPWDNQKLLGIVDKQIVDKQIAKIAIASDATAKQAVNRKTNTETVSWVAESEAMQQLEAVISQIADTQASVLILGENGTGKSLLAQRLHQLSGRNSAPFVSVNMGAIPENLFESELFGHKKGAFTDARENRQGRFELAQHGTLFLDEIGTLPASVQPKMLRVLESGEFEPVGASQTLHADVRVISATNADLDQLVAAGEFRRDLKFRLNTFVLTLPPLRARQADILPLANSLLAKFSAKYHKPALTLSNDVMALLKNYTWPGNVRELSHVIERAVILCRDSDILSAHIMLSELNSPGDVNGEEASSAVQADDSELRPLDDIEFEMITKALKKYQGHISKASAALGISRNALYRRMEKYQLDKEEFDLE
ncbi:sigma-54-dependent Fis family transcriptional regulator [Thalassotalea euphylliae]|uniref:Sigma-54-dependent Fis family transcriptional regulator n=1 Tax=Thalassotalea euphylliae TaxID=1655234 RepID=A0A3E0TVD7_9GAMM|nr:sigma-54 dependent transcriptional regulator [Thalassotalea euphylliae]REL28631.1 sigma-54-dependent Fis family transcriptional regulator [Thalassotalea euphylliae]